VQIFDYAPTFVNKTVNASAIEECQALFFTASWAIKNFGIDIFSTEVAAAPFLPQQYQDFFVGGMDDNAAWTSFMWNRMLSWSRHGPPPAPLPPVQSQGAVRLPKALSALVSALRPLLHDGTLSTIVQLQPSFRGTTASLVPGAAATPAAARVVDSMRAVLGLPVGDPAPVPVAVAAEIPAAMPEGRGGVLAGSVANEYFGSATCSGDIDGDGIAVC
jgi:hypothetical protein